MTFKKWLNRYCGMFVADQAIGIATSLVGFWIPNFYLYWLHSYEASVWGLVTILASVTLIGFVFKQKRSPLLYVLPAYHLAGMVLMQLRVSTVASRLTDTGWFVTVQNSKVAANFAALQDFDVTWLSLAHSSVGLVVGIVAIVMVRLKPDSTHEQATEAQR